MYVTGTLLLIPSAPKGRFYRIRTIPRQATGFPDTCRNPVVLVPGVESEFHRRSAVIGINFFSSGSGGLNVEKIHQSLVVLLRRERRRLKGSAPPGAGRHRQQDRDD